MPAPDDAFRLAAFEPAYLAARRDGRLGKRTEQAQAALESCRLCPRACGARRLDGERGSCQVARRAVVSSAFPHLGEEDCLRGRQGSGTIFFSGGGPSSRCTVRSDRCASAETAWRGAACWCAIW